MSTHEVHWLKLTASVNDHDEAIVEASAACGANENDVTIYGATETVFAMLDEAICCEACCDLWNERQRRARPSAPLSKASP